MGYVVVGGTIVPEALVDKAARRGITVLRSYGSTEHPTITSSLITDSPEQLRSTDGKVLPGVEVVIKRADGSTAPAAVEGEIHSRGPDRSAGYLDEGENVGTFDAASGSTTPTLVDITAHVARIGMAKPKWPEELRLVDTFPRTASGKVQKYPLRNGIR